MSKLRVAILKDSGDDSEKDHLAATHILVSGKSNNLYPVK